MNIVRKIHDQFRVKTVAGAQLETPEAVSSQGAGGSTFITITGGGGTSLNGSGLSEEDRVKLDSIEQGAQVNQDAFSKIQFDATSIDGNNQSSSSNSSIIANVPTDTANIKIVGNYPITVNLESVSLFNSNTSTTTGTTITTYNISFNSSNNIVIEYVDGTLLNAADVELIQVKHKESVLATYQLSDITYTTSEGTITSFTIPYSNTDFSEIEFCKYETVTTETEEGSTTVRELRVLSTLPASPTKQSIITLNSLTDSFWNYEEDENGNKFVWTDYNVYSTKDVSAYGRSTGTGGSYASNLYELNDVVLTNLSNNDLLIYDSSTSKWVNINKDQLGISADQLHTLTISVNGVTQATYNPASADSSVNISTITLNEVTEYIDQKIDTKLDVSEFFKWFTINYDSNNNVVSIQANFDFYSIGGVSAYGLGDIGGSSRTTLATLDDVSLSNLITNDMLAYNGSKWVNIPMSQVRGVTSWSDLENKPTTISGFGITDAYTKTEVNTKISEVSSKVTELSSSKADATIQVIAGNGLTGGGNLQQDITIALQNLNSTGTYYKVNVDTYGRVTSGISQLTIADIQNLQTQLDSKLNIADFNTWFTIIYNTDGTIKNIQANYDFYSVGEVSAYGVGDEEKKTYTTLAELNDVQLTNVKETDVLVYNGTKWINVDQSTIKGAQSWTDIQNKPTTISGFGIVDAYTKTEIDNKLSPINSSITTINSSINTINTNISDLSSSLSGVSTKLNNFLEGSDTDTIINKWKELEAFLAGYTQTQTLADLLSVKANSSIQIIAGTGLVGGGDLTANRTISLSTSGVSAGTYTKVTVDTYGRVTSGSTLSATDIPNLDWSKITSGKPTTLEGYGITDGVNNITFTGSGNAITAVTISNHLLTFTKGETFLPKSTFDDLFEKVNVGTTSNPVYAIKAKYNLYSVGEVSAYEFGEAGGTGSSSLEELIDVQLTNLVADSILKYNGSKWVNIPITEVKGATSWNEIEDKPSTFTPSAHTHTVADITDISTKYVSISTTQTVSGLKTFTSTIKYQPTYYSYNAEDIEYRTMSGTLFGGIGAVHNGSSISYFYIGKGSTPWDTKDGLTIGDELGFKGYTVWHSGNAIIPTVPTKLSAFKNDSGYLTAITKAQVEGVLTGDITSHTHSFASLTSKPTTAVGYGIADAIYFTDNTNYAAARFATQAIANRAASTYIEWWQSGAGFFNHKAAKYIVDGGTSSQFLKGDGSLDSTAYLPLSGGKLSSNILTNVLTLNSNVANAGTYLKLEYCGSKVAEFGYGYGLDTYMWCNSHVLRITSDGTAYVDSHTLIHSGNIGSQSVNYATSASNADTVDNEHASAFAHIGAHNNLMASGNEFTFALSGFSGNVYINYRTAGGYNGNITGYDFYNGAGGLLGTAIHTGNYNSYSPTLTGSGASGTWGISITGNAATATKLQTARTIWGQSFDGTGNVSGSLTGVYEIYGGGGIYLNSDSWCPIKITRGTLGTSSIGVDGDGVFFAHEQNSAIAYMYLKAGTGLTVHSNIAVTGAVYTGSTLQICRSGDGSVSTEFFKIDVSDVAVTFNASDSDGFSRMYFQSNGNSYVTFDGYTQRVGIGTASPSYKLDVNGDVNTSNWYCANATYGLYLKTGVCYTDIRSYPEIDSAGNEIVFGSGSDDLYVNYRTSRLRTTAVTKWLWYGGSSTTYASFTLGSITSNGNIAATGEVTAKASSSDIRLKTDITDYKALSIIRSHKSIKYHWNEVAKANADIFNDDYWHYGLIAQDVQKDMPQMVSDVFKDYLVINYERLIPICWKGLQEVDDEVTKLKKRVKQLERRLQKYESTEVFYTKGND